MANGIVTHQALNTDVTRMMLTKKNECQEICKSTDDGYMCCICFKRNYGASCCRKLKEGDIIGMVLDLFNDQLNYSLNGQDTKSFDLRNEEYRAVIVFYQSSHRDDIEDIQIVFYENEYCIMYNIC